MARSGLIAKNALVVISLSVNGLLYGGVSGRCRPSRPARAQSTRPHFRVLAKKPSRSAKRGADAHMQRSKYVSRSMPATAGYAGVARRIPHAGQIAPRLYQVTSWLDGVIGAVTRGSGRNQSTNRHPGLGRSRCEQPKIIGPTAWRTAFSVRRPQQFGARHGGDSGSSCSAVSEPLDWPGAAPRAGRPRPTSAAKQWTSHPGYRRQSAKSPRKDPVAGSGVSRSARSTIASMIVSQRSGHRR